MPAGVLYTVEQSQIHTAIFLDSALYKKTGRFVLPEIKAGTGAGVFSDGLDGEEEDDDECVRLWSCVSA